MAVRFWFHNTVRLAVDELPRYRYLLVRERGFFQNTTDRCYIRNRGEQHLQLFLSRWYMAGSERRVPGHLSRW